MDQTTLAIIVSLLIASVIAGLFWQARQGKISDGHGSDISPALLVPGAWLTLVQVSAPLCSYCQAMRGILGRAASTHEGVGHVEYDISEVPEIIEKFQVRQTPTTFLVEADGRVAHQIGGPLAPAALDELIRQTHDDVEKRSDEYEI